MVGATPRREQLAPTAEEMKKSLPKKADKLSWIKNMQKDPYSFDWASLLNYSTAGLAGIGNEMENNRQDQYRYEQMAMMGRPDYASPEQYQPNPYSLYAKYGGSLKKYQEGGRLVQQVPTGYQPLKTEGNRQYYGMQQQVNAAQNVIPTKNPAQYEQSLIQKFQNGLDPNAAAGAGLISKDNVARFMPYYKKDIVYTEKTPVPQQQEQEAPWYQNAAFRENVFNNSGHMVGYTRVPSRNTRLLNEAGGIDTSMQDVEFAPVVTGNVDNQGQLTGDTYRIPFGERNNYQNASKTWLTMDGLDKYKSQPLTSRKQGGTIDDLTRYAIYSKILPQIFKMGSLQKQSRWRGKKGGLTPNKAREILHDGTAQGHALTDKQRRFFGAKSKGHTNFK